MARWAPIAAAAGVPVAVDLAVAGVGLSIVALGSKVLLLPDVEADAPEPTDQPVERIHLRNAPRLLRLLGPIALLGLLGVMLEDAAQTWSTVYLVDVLGLAAGIAAVAFVLYTGAMAVGRLTNDRWVDRWGDARIGRWGGGAGRRRARARGAGRARRASPLDRVRRVHRRWRRRVVDVPADGRRRRLAAGHPGGARGRDRRPGWRGPGS